MEEREAEEIRGQYRGEKVRHRSQSGQMYASDSLS
jgi:hypothetical protein